MITSVITISGLFCITLYHQNLWLQQKFVPYECCESIHRINWTGLICMPHIQWRQVSELLCLRFSIRPRGNKHVHRIAIIKPSRIANTVKTCGTHDMVTVKIQNLLLCDICWEMLDHLAYYLDMVLNSFYFSLSRRFFFAEVKQLPIE